MGRFYERRGQSFKTNVRKNCPPDLPCLLASSDRYHYAKYRAEDLSGFFGTLILFSERGVLDDELNFVPFKY